MIEALTQKGERESLLQLCIVQYVQKRNEVTRELTELEDLVSAKMFKNLQSMNLCSTYFPLKLHVEVPDEQND